MKQKFLSLLSIMFLTAALAAQTAVKSDSAVSPAQPKTSDEELILDESDKTAPQPEKKNVAAPAVDTAKKAAPVKAASPSVSAPGPAPAPTISKDTAKKIVDEELILDGGAEDLLGQEKAPVKKTASPVKSSTDSTAAGAAKSGADSAAAATAPAPTDSTAKAADSGVQAPAVAIPAPAEPVAAEKIEKVRSINFAANLKEYRSPKLAMLMSLLLPGSGQFYAKSNVTAAACLAVEVALAGTGYAFAKKGQDQRKKARKYADSHYSAEKFSNYDSDLKAFLLSTLTDQNKADSIYYGIIYFGDSSAAENFKNDANRKNDAYYDNISLSSSPFVRGWDDVAPGFSAQTGIEITGSDTALYGQFPGDSGYFAYKKKVPGKYPGYGFSQNQIAYSDMVSEAQGLSRIGNRFYMSLLVNHLASAVIAGIVAKKHNDELLGKESFWQRIDVEEQMVNTGTTTVTGYALAVRF